VFIQGTGSLAIVHGKGESVEGGDSWGCAKQVRRETPAG